VTTTLPPGAIVVPPGGQLPANAVQSPQFPAVQTTPPGPPIQTSPDIRHYQPATTDTWGPGKGVQARFDAIDGGQQPDGVRLQQPGAERAAPQRLVPQRDISGFPAGIPAFASVRENVSTGQKPFTDGLDWLKDNGYRSVLHIQAPGEADAADRRQVEQRGLRYLHIELSPETLNKKTVDSFTQMITDSGNQPLFVYDRDGTLAGPLWYLFFRTADHQPDDQARIRAGRLGLKDSQDPDQRAMWLAIQKYVGENLR
jgi:protein tyrosine phosphatase (PTP) superfamily phosphohydrolase (DUF442 family)